MELLKFKYHQVTGMNFQKLLIIGYLSVISTYCLAGNNYFIDLNNLPPKQFISVYAGYYFDNKGDSGIDDIIAIDFQNTLAGDLNFGFSNKTVWVKICLGNTGNIERKSRLILDNHFLDSIDIFLVNDTLILKHIQSGTARIKDPQGKAFLSGGIDIAVGAGVKLDIYLRIKSGSPVRIPVFLYTEEAFLGKVAFDNRLNGMYYGIIGFLILFNLYLYFYSKDRMYFYYVLGMFFYLLYLLAFDNTLNIIFGNYYSKKLLHLVLSFSGLVILFFVLFSEKFFQISDGETRAKRTFFILKVVSSVCFLLMFFEYYTGNRIMIMFAPFYLVVLVSLAIFYKLKGLVHLRLYLIAGIGALLSIALFSLAATGIAGSILIYKYSIKTGLLFQGIVFSLATVDKFLINQRDFNRLLQEKVKEKTAVYEKQRDEINFQSESLKATNQKLVELDELKEGLTSMIVHDLKIPLHNIINHPADIEPSRLLYSIRQSGHHMLNLVMNILDVYKYEKHGIELNSETIQANKIIERAVEQLNLLASQKNISIRYKVPSNLLIYADAGMIERVFINLLTNAVNYTPPNGKVIVDYSCSGEKECRFLVTDSGPGIPPEKEHLVFVKFGQVISKKTGDIRSTGLGLTFCKIAVEAHHGRIGFFANESGGTVFWFSLPGDCFNPQPDEENGTGQTINKNLMVIKEMTWEDKELLKPFVEQLRKIEIYRISMIRSVLARIDQEKEEIKVWKEALIDAVYSNNEELYFKILNFCA
jgi:signal transduction histidine kinase